MRILYVCTCMVEADNFLPLIHAVRESSGVDDAPRQEILVLDMHTRSLGTPLVRRVMAGGRVFAVPAALGLRGWRRTAAGLLSRASAAAEGMLQRGGGVFVQRVVGRTEKLLRLLLERLLRNTPTPEEGEPYDFSVMAEGLYANGLNPERRGELRYRVLHDLVHRNVETGRTRLVLMPETYDQWVNRPEYAGVRREVVHAAHRLFSRGDAARRDTAVPFDRAVAVGSPRYSEEWCRMAKAAAPEPAVPPLKRPVPAAEAEGELKRELRVLYLPLKISGGTPGATAETIAEHDRFVFGLLERYDDLRILLKPHPRGWRLYADVSRLTPRPERVTLLPRTTDTCSAARAADLMVTGGTSFVPHMLWTGRPVVLLDDWAVREGWSFVYAPFCSGPDDIDGILDGLRDSLRDGASDTAGGPDPDLRRELEKFFQCGLSGKDYDSRLVTAVREVFSR